MKKFKVAGVSLAVVKDGKIIHEKGYGVRAVETKLPVVDEHTIFKLLQTARLLQPPLCQFWLMKEKFRGRTVNS